jgi:hypothetical protein
LLKKFLHQIYINKFKIYKVNYIGIILITIGIFLICYSSLDVSKLDFNKISKLSITMILIGIFIIILQIGEITTNHYTDSLMIFIIILSITVCIITMLSNVSYHLIFILIEIGLLSIYEITSESLPKLLKNKLQFLIFWFFLIFLILVYITIMSIPK